MRSAGCCPCHIRLRMNGVFVDAVAVGQRKVPECLGSPVIVAQEQASRKDMADPDIGHKVFLENIFAGEVDARSNRIAGEAARGCL